MRSDRCPNLLLDTFGWMLACRFVESICGTFQKERQVTYTIEQLKGWYQPFVEDVRAPRHCGDSSHIIQELIAELESRDREIERLRSSVRMLDMLNTESSAAHDQSIRLQAAAEAQKREQAAIIALQQQLKDNCDLHAEIERLKIGHAAALQDRDDTIAALRKEAHHPADTRPIGEVLLEHGSAPGDLEEIARLQLAMEAAHQNSS